MAKDQTEVKKTDVINQQSQVQQQNSTEKVDSSTTKKESHTEAKNTSKQTVTLNPDSVKVNKGTNGSTTTTFYTHGKPVNINTETTSDINSSEATDQANNIKDKAQAFKDSTGKRNDSLASDSTHLHKDTDAKGSGTVWASYIPIVGGCVLVVIAGLVFLYFKLKK